MDMSPWKCGECGCQQIAFDLAVCPQCGAPKTEPEPEPAAEPSPAAAKKTATAKE